MKIMRLCRMRLKCMQISGNRQQRREGMQISRKRRWRLKGMQINQDAPKAPQTPRRKARDTTNLAAPAKFVDISPRAKKHYNSRASGTMEKYKGIGAKRVQRKSKKNNFHTQNKTHYKTRDFHDAAPHTPIEGSQKTI